jgi:hypothetical protein
MVEQYPEIVGPHQVIAAGREQNGFWHPVSVQLLFQQPGESLRLPAGIRHLLGCVPEVSHRFDIVTVLVLQQAQDVGPRVVEPRVPFGDQDTR